MSAAEEPVPRGDLRTRARALLATGLRADGCDEDGSPRLAVRGDGAFVADDRGRRRIDLSMGYGALPLGHGAPEIVAALRDQCGAGTILSRPHVLEVEVAERLVDAIPCAERVAFGKNGSDVCTAAVRIARVATGRPGVLHWGYHGFHDWCAVTNPSVEGLPAGLGEQIHTLPHGDLDQARAIFAEHAARIAAVVVEPFRAEPVDVEWLRGLRALTERHGAVLVFDELVTGFRVHRGGAQTLLGVTPDLACFGKALAHGMPLSALCGRADLMELAPRVGVGMTMRGESLSLAAARAALDLYARRDVPAELAATGAALRHGFDALARTHGLAAHLAGHPAMMAFVLPDDLRAAFLSALARHGVDCLGNLLTATVHAPLIQPILDACDAALADTARERASHGM